MEPVSKDVALNFFLQAYDAYEEFTMDDAHSEDGAGRYARMITARIILRESMEAEAAK